MRDQELYTRKKLNLGIDAIGTVDTILSWDKLEMCFGHSFRFSNEAKFEITKELAVQQGRLQKLSFGKKSAETCNFQDISKNLADKIEKLMDKNNGRAPSIISDLIKTKTGGEVKSFCDALRAIGNADTIFESERPSELYRDIIRKIVKILSEEKIPLSLHVQSALNKFMTELDRQLPETIFPYSDANYIEEGRVRILKDYLRGYLRSNT